MRTGGLTRALWRLSVPVMFAQISETVLHVTDTAFLARVGVTELGAIAIADLILELFLVVPLGLVDGIQVLSARHAARRRPEGVGEVFRHGLAMIVLTSVVLAALVAIGSPALSAWLVDSQGVTSAVDDFLRVAAAGLPLTAATFAYSALLVSLGRTRVLIPATLILTFTNLGLDYVLIFGKLGLPALGIQGAALGSVGAELATFVFLTWYLARRLEHGRYGLFRLGHWSRTVARRLIRLSAPVSMQALVEALRWFAFFLIIERVGVDALAVANVVYACYEVFRIPTEGFTETACSMVSRFIARDQGARIGAVVGRSIAGAALVTLPLSLVALVAPGWVLSVFDLGGGLRDAGISSLRVVALSMAVVIPAEMWLTAVVGSGDTRAAFGIEAALTVVMLAAAYWVAIPLAGPAALIWTALPVAWLVCLVLSYGWMRSGAWRRADV